MSPPLAGNGQELALEFWREQPPRKWGLPAISKTQGQRCTHLVALGARDEVEQCSGAGPCFHQGKQKG
jgi:hypothetical protein